MSLGPSAHTPRSDTIEPAVSACRVTQTPRSQTYEPRNPPTVAQVGFHYRGRESLEVLAGPPVRLTTWRSPCPSHGVGHGRRPAATTGPVVRRLGYGTRPAVPAGGTRRVQGRRGTARYAAASRVARTSSATSSIRCSSHPSG